jgi:hypothetical protein
MGKLRLTEEMKGELGNKYIGMMNNGATGAEAAETIGHKMTTLRDWHLKYGRLVNGSVEPVMSATRLVKECACSKKRTLLKAQEIPEQLRAAAEIFETLLKALGYVVE